MVDLADLLVAVDSAFSSDTGRGPTPWDNPWPNRPPPHEAYSRLLDPRKWRIVGARAEAWMVALKEAGLAVVRRNASITWIEEPETSISRTDRVDARAAGSLPLIVCRSRLGDVEDAGVTVGVGDPAIYVDAFPSCGCDACDRGSQDELDRFDARMVSVVSGTFRRLWDVDRVITVDGPTGWSAGGRTPGREFRPGEVDAVIADPSGWHELSGSSWLGAT